MAGVAVASLDLALKLPGGLRPQAGALERRTREDFIPAMLRAMERKLAAHYGELAVIRIRQLDLKLRISAAELASPELAETVADDFAEHLKSQAMLPGSRDFTCPGAVPLVVYADPAHFAAVRLAAAAQRSPGPDGEKEALDRVWTELRAVPRATLARAVVRLFEGGRLAAVLAALPLAAARAMPRELGADLPKAVLRAIRVALATCSDAPPARTTSGKVEPVAESPTTKPEHDPDDATPERQSARAVPKVPGKNIPSAKPKPLPRDPARRGKAKDEPGALESLAPLAQPDPAVGETRVPNFDLPTAPIRQQPSPPPEVAPAVEPIADSEPQLLTGGPLHFASNWCGLAYLLRIALLCELPERLWQIGVDEGTALARALGLVAGEPDPVWLFLSERFPDPPKPLGHVPAWALDELREGTLAAGIALFGDEVARAELDAAIAASLARLDGSSEDTLATWLAAFLLAMFGLLSGIESAGGSIATQFSRSGRLLMDSDEITVMQPLAQIDIEVRRAGLDADPGWLAWRRVTLRLAFVGEESLP